MEKNHAEWKGSTIEDLIALPEAEYRFMLKRIERERLARQGFVFIDEDHPASPCASCEG